MCNEQQQPPQQQHQQQQQPQQLNNSNNNNNNNTPNEHLAMATVRPISPRNQEALDQAIWLAKELASKSIADSRDSSPKTPNSPDKRRFNFKFKPFSKSFSEASASIRDIESSISSEEKQAYNSLIEHGQFNHLHSASSSSSSPSSASTNQFTYPTRYPSSNHHHHGLNQHHHHSSYHNSHTFGRSGSRSSSGSTSSRGSSALHSPQHDPLFSSSSPNTLTNRPFASNTLAHTATTTTTSTMAPSYANDDFSLSPTSISSFTSLSTKTFKRGCSTISAKRSFF